MSFGRPSSMGETFALGPPQRGSFPLDHDGDCKDAMKLYLSCLRANANNNGKCRLESKRYLQCRMDNNLMERDDFGNLGLGDVQDPSRVITTSATSPVTPTTPKTTTDGPPSEARSL